MRKLLNIASTVLLGLTLLLTFFAVGIRIFGFTPYIVVSGSMEPAYHTGSVLYVRSVNPEEIHKGDVITFRISDEILVTHRVVEIIGSGNQVLFRTKGDANEREDSFIVSSSYVVGKAQFTIPKLGLLLEYIHTTPGRWAAISVGVFLMTLVSLPDFLYPEERGRTNARWSSLRRVGKHEERRN